MAERIDEIGFGGYKLIQDTDCFCYGIDAVIAADFCELNGGEKIADLGTGNGAIPLILCGKFREKKAPSKIYGIELQEKSASIARRNVTLNNLEDKIEIINDDILNIKDHLDFESLDVVVSNPPYTEKQCGPVSFASEKLIARHETTADLRDFFRTAAYLLKPKARLIMVHRPSRLVDLLSYGREFGLEAKALKMVAPKPGEGANLVLIKYVKGGGKELLLCPQLFVRDESGSYSEEINRIYER